ncbi:MAG: flagellar motor switch protein FliM, partial [Chloroflexota bacterium]|nr:flagellar motor switch protein FliM [Chloroflexota bacterium]
TLHETFGRLLTSSLSGTLRMPVNISLASIEQGIYDEFLQSLKSPTVLNIISLEPLPGSALFEIEMNLAYAFIERLLGGVGKGWNRTRELTDLEVVLIKGLGNTIVDNLRDAWVNVMDIDPKLEDITLSPQFARVALPTEAVLTIVFEIRVSDVTGTISLCLPFPILEPVLPRLNPQLWISGARRAALKDSADLIKKNMDAVKVAFAVELGGSDVGVEEILKVQKGDIIRLDRLMNQELDILIGGERKFRGRPGLVGQRVSVQITGLHPESEVQ